MDSIWLNDLHDQVTIAAYVIYLFDSIIEKWIFIHNLKFSSACLEATSATSSEASDRTNKKKLYCAAWSWKGEGIVQRGEFKWQCSE